MSTPCPNIILAAPVLNTADRSPLLNQTVTEVRKESFHLPVQHSPCYMCLQKATISSCPGELTYKCLLSISLVELPSVYQSSLWT